MPDGDACFFNVSLQMLEAKLVSVALSLKSYLALTDGISKTKSPSGTSFHCVSELSLYSDFPSRPVRTAFRDNSDYCKQI